MNVVVSGSEMPVRTDIETFNELEANSQARVAIAQGRAQKWLAAITALTGLLTTVLILKAPEKASDVEEGVLWVVAGLVMFALVLLAMAIQAAYSAAFGETTDSIVPDMSPVKGVFARRLDARLRLERATFASLERAIRCAVGGVIVVGLASVLLWTGGSPKAADATPESRCVSDAGGVLVALSGSTVSLSEVRDGVTIGDCPE